MVKNHNVQMTKGETIAGLVYLPVHAVVLQLLLAVIIAVMSVNMPDDATTNFILYSIGFIYCLICMHKFLGRSLREVYFEKGKVFKTVITGVLLYFALNIATNIVVMSAVGMDGMLENPNNAAVTAMLDKWQMRISAVILAPVLEECLFRGALFGSISKRNRIAGYIVCVLLFSFYHLWYDFIFEYEWRLWFYLLQYAAPTVVLCRAYEKSGTIWCPIFIHMLINLFATWVQSLI